MKLSQILPPVIYIVIFTILICVATIILIYLNQTKWNVNYLSIILVVIAIIIWIPGVIVIVSRSIKLKSSTYMHPLAVPPSPKRDYVASIPLDSTNRVTNAARVASKLDAIRKRLKRPKIYPRPSSGSSTGPLLASTRPSTGSPPSSRRSSFSLAPVSGVGSESIRLQDVQDFEDV